VKAAFLLNFARFTEWPAEAFTSPGAPFTVGVLGDEELRLALDTLASASTFSSSAERRRRKRRTW